eukprot:15364964-Ditylum_brightwellii.AAC.2
MSCQACRVHPGGLSECPFSQVHNGALMALSPMISLLASTQIVMLNHELLGPPCSSWRFFRYIEVATQWKEYTLLSSNISPPYRVYLHPSP